MSLGFNSQSSSQSSEPVDVVPGALKGLRRPYANLIQNLLAGGGKQATGVLFRDMYDKETRQAMGRNQRRTIKGQIAATQAIPNYQTATGNPLVAPITSGEQSIVDKITQSATSPTGNTAQIDQYLKDVIGGNYLPGQEGNNPFLQAAIEAAQRPTLQGLEETLGRTLPGRFTLSGQQTQPRGSSAFDRAAALATGQTATALGDIASQISFGAYEGERGRQQEAVGLSQAQVDTTVKQLQAAALPRLIQDLGVERGLAEFQNRTEQLLKLLAVVTQTPLVQTGQKSQSESSGLGFNFGV